MSVLVVRLLGWGLVSLLCIWQLPVAAQQSSASADNSLRERQAELGEQLLRNPANIQLMFDHAATSIRLEDYESAITSLERLLMFDQDLSRVRLELGVSYFNLGSYGVAKLYLQQVLADDTITEEVRNVVDGYLAAINKRTQSNRLTVIVNLGATYSTNANLAPSDDTVTIGGVPGFVLVGDGRKQDDFGVRVLVHGKHRLDLERENDDAWLTDFSLFGLRYSDADSGNALAARVRTGPSLNLTDEANGPKIRPYVDLSYLNSDDESVYYGAFLGAEAFMPLANRWFGFTDLSAGYFDYTARRNADDRFGFRGQIGAAWQPQRNMLGRMALVSEYYNARADRNSSIEFGARLSGQVNYTSGLDFISERWVLSAFTDARFRFYDEADPFIDPNTVRDEFDFRLGISHLFAIHDGFGIQLDLEGFFRDANIQNFDLNSQSVTVSAQYRF